MMTPSNHSLQEITQAILEKNHFTLVGHLIPDGDCIGSLIALHLVLEDLGKMSNILLKDAIPSNYFFLTGSEHIQNLQTIPQIYENIIFLDCADQERSGMDVTQAIKEKATFIMNIDHHGTNKRFGHLNYVDATAAATGEILVSLIHAMKQNISPAVAEALYTAMVMDTGNFQYSSTTSHTLKTAATLLEHGADLNRVRIAMFESKDKRDIQMMALALSHMQMSDDQKIAWMYVTQEEVRSIHAEDFHPEGLVNFLRSIKGVEIAVYFRQVEKNVIKIALRSKNELDVSKIAAHFGGGGHIQAAGARFEGTLEETMQTVISYIGEVLNTR